MRILLLIWVAALLPVDLAALAAGSATQPKIPPNQLDALVVPIALYSDALLAQTLSVDDAA